MDKRRFHAFLSHNSADKAAVEQLARRLTQEGVDCWLDKWHLIPGTSWQPAIERVLLECESYVVFIGPSGIGPWQNEEMRAAIDRRVAETKGEYRVIPVILPGGRRDSRLRLPTFLVSTTWVEFNESLGDEHAFHRLKCGILGIEPGQGSGEMTYDGKYPYIGLRTFQPEHAQLFFGREARIEWILEKLRCDFGTVRENRFLAVVGASGSGKSSLARAGLIPAIRQNRLPGSSAWPVVICRPGRHPLEELAKSLYKDPVIREAAHDVGDLIDRLSEESRRLHLTTSTALYNSPPTRRVAILVDQLEEVFTLCESEDRRQIFLDNLMYATSVPEGRTVVILTMRADFYGKASGYPRLAAALSDYQDLVPAMTEEELRRAIEMPARLCGGEFEAGLVELLLQDTKGQAGSLPLLQYTLRELWKNRGGRRVTVATYKAMGKLEGALERNADTMFKELDEHERAMCRQIFLRLIRPDETGEYTKTRVSKVELGEGEYLESVLQKLLEIRLIAAAGSKEKPNEPLIELAHEALIYCWPRLGTWIEANREDLRLRYRLSRDASEWSKNEDPGLLYRGARLAQVNEYSQMNDDALNPGESRFLETSIQNEKLEKERELELLKQVAEAEKERSRLARKRERDQAIASKRSRKLAWTGMAAGLGAIIFAVVVWQLSKDKDHLLEENRKTLVQLQRELDISSAYRMSTLSNDVRRDYPQRSVLLAVEAVNAVRDAKRRIGVAEQALRDSLAAISGIGFKSEDLKTIIVISQDHQWLVTLRDLWVPRKKVYLWNLRGFREGVPTAPHLLHHQDDDVTYAAFSTDSQWLATGSVEGTIALWDLSESTESNRHPKSIYLEGHSGVVRNISFSPKNRWLVSTNRVGTARIWDLDSIINGQATDSTVWSQSFVGDVISFSSDDRWLGLATGTSAQLWDLTVIGGLDSESISMGGHKHTVDFLSFSGDGRWFATGDPYLGDGQLWNLTETDRRLSVESIYSELGEIGTDSMLFSPDSRWLAYDADDDVVLLKLETGTSVDPILLRGHNRMVDSLALSPDSHWIASADRMGFLYLWDMNIIAKTGLAPKPVVLQAHAGSVSSLEFSPDSRWLASSSHDNLVRLWDVRSLENDDESIGEVVLRGRESPVARVEFSIDGGSLAAITLEREVRLWDMKGIERNTDFGAIVLNSSISDDHVDDLTLLLSPDDRWLVVSERFGSTELWDLMRIEDEPDMESVVLPGRASHVPTVAITDDGRWLFAGSADGSLRLWNLSSFGEGSQAYHGEPIIVKGHSGQVIALAISNKTNGLVTGSMDRTARLWNLETAGEGMSSILLEGLASDVSHVAFSTDGRWLAAEDRLWDLTNIKRGVGMDPFLYQEREENLRKKMEDARCRLENVDEKRSLLEKKRGILDRLRSDLPPPRKAETFELEREVRDLYRELREVERLFEYYRDRIRPGRGWSKDDIEKLLVEYRAFDGSIGSLAMSPDGRWAAVGGLSVAWLWPLDELKSDPNAGVVPLPGHTFWVREIAFSADSRWLATGDRAARLWDLTSLRENKALVPKPILLDQGTNEVRIAFSQDNRWLATFADFTDTVQLWNLVSMGEPQAPSQIVLRGHDGNISTLAFSRHGQWLATGSEDTTVRLWNLQALEESAAAQPITLRGHESTLVAIRFDSQNRWLITLDTSRTVRLWYLEADKLVKVAMRTVGRNFSLEEWSQYFSGEYRATFQALPTPP
ncbi:MAG: TIR domain-containing protein [Deltaproteobacteria bacterium]|nr:TIR domain-containing protein [Deltaproteobacteria bacterium]